MKIYAHPTKASDALGPSLPSIDDLAAHAPATLWRLAFQTAYQVTNQRFRMGAVIWNGEQMFLGYSQLCSDKDYRAGCASLHAERHALMEGAHVDLTGSLCVVVGVNKNGNGSPWSSCPCVACADALHQRGVSRVLYPQRTCTGEWIVQDENPAHMLTRAPSEMLVDVDKGLFAREARLAVVA